MIRVKLAFSAARRFHCVGLNSGLLYHLIISQTLKSKLKAKVTHKENTQSRTMSLKSIQKVFALIRLNKYWVALTGSKMSRKCPIILPELDAAIKYEDRLCLFRCMLRPRGCVHAPQISLPQVTPWDQTWVSRVGTCLSSPPLPLYSL